jgi:hypothetical protein
MNRKKLIQFAEENNIHAQIQSFDHGDEVWLSYDYEKVTGLGGSEPIGLWKKRISLSESDEGLWVVHFSQAGETVGLNGDQTKEFVLKWKNSERGDYSFAEVFTSS